MAKFDVGARVGSCEVQAAEQKRRVERSNGVTYESSDLEVTYQCDCGEVIVLWASDWKEENGKLRHCEDRVRKPGRPVQAGSRRVGVGVTLSFETIIMLDKIREETGAGLSSVVQRVCDEWSACCGGEAKSNAKKRGQG